MNIMSRGAFAAAILVAGGAAAAIQAKPMNVVVIVADDLGWKDVGYNGAVFFETPNIDRLAERGMIFSNAYSDGAVCSPTRAALLSGKSPARTGITNAGTPRMEERTKRNGGFGEMKAPWPACSPYKPPLTPLGLPSSEKTIAEYVKQQGYATACIGKWHLAFGGTMPEEQGFDVTLGATKDSGWCSYHPPYDPVNYPNVVPGEHLTYRIGREAEAFITDHRSDPFFLYLTPYSVHGPYEPIPENLQYFVNKSKGAPTDVSLKYAALLKGLDDLVGRVVTSLEKAGVADHTAILFWADNGPVVFDRHTKRGKGRKVNGQRLTRVSPLRGEKAWLYEGGIRVPAFCYVPGSAPARTISEPVITTDILPTILELTGISPDAPELLDGRSLLPLLKGESLARDTLCWHYPHWGWPASAIRKGNYKLIYFYGRGCELYDLQNDLGETRNLAAGMPEKTEAMKKELLDWLDDCDALMPTPNPDFDPALPPQDPRPEVSTGGELIMK
ncbi:sulfatase [Pontiellaceae bacterium B12227]|nr:sulfatase [Pontiellaceae bacterium B12227]